MVIIALPLDEIFDRFVPLIVLTINFSHKIQTCCTFDNIFAIYFIFSTFGYASERICGFICLILLEIAQGQHKETVGILALLQNRDCIVQISDTMVTCRQNIQIIFAGPLSTESQLNLWSCDVWINEDVHSTLDVQRRIWHHQAEMSRCKPVSCPLVR